MSDGQERLLGALSHADGWVTAAELADSLGVSTRTVRSYVNAVKSSAGSLDVIESSTSGYRLDRELYARFRSDLAGSRAESPRDRAYHLLRRIADSPGGIDVFSLASASYVSESTIESDLRKLRAELEGSGVTLPRRGDVVGMAGSESDVRRVLSRLFRDEEAQGFLELETIEREFASSDLRGFKTRLIGALDAHGYFVNEYGVNNVLLHVAIAVDRTITTRPADAAAQPAGPPHDTSGSADIAAEVDSLVRDHFGVELEDSDLDYLAQLLTTRVLTRGVETDADGTPATSEVDHELRAVRAIVERVAEEYLVDLHDEEFIVRLALHVHNLIARAQDNAYSRNPMSRSIKTSYPMIYELAVFISSELQRRENIVINDDEISYIALHVGAFLERQSKRETRITCAIVCPGYYDMHLLLRERLEAVLGDELQIEVVITRTDVDWSDLSSALVLTTIDSGSFAPNVVTIQPFLTDGDVESIRRAIARIRRQSRRARLRDDLSRFFDASMFVRGFTAPDEISMIEALGERMIAAGVIGADYVAGAIERERLSSTAFTDTLAVPHSLQMTATRTAICIAVDESPMAWGESRVNVVAFIAFSASDRATFQAIFDQFVSVFADRAVVQHLVKRAVDLPSFIEEIVRAIDS